MIRQFKLTSGEEILCEVINGNNIGPIGAFLLVRNCVCIDSVRSANTSLHTLRPYFINQDKFDQIMSIYIPHIMAQAVPDSVLLEHYQKYIESDSPGAPGHDLDVNDSDSKKVIKFPKKILH